MRYFIFCGACALEALDEDSSFYLAMFGPQGVDDDEDACLTCSAWDAVPSFFRDLLRMQPFACDGCQKLVAVSASSDWFVERHRKERA